MVDDSLATGGKVECEDNLVRKNGKDVCSLVTVVELKELGENLDSNPRRIDYKQILMKISEIKQ